MEYVIRCDRCNRVLGASTVAPKALERAVARGMKPRPGKHLCPECDPTPPLRLTEGRKRNGP